MSILTLSDLYNYYASLDNNSSTEEFFFSANTQNDAIHVFVDGVFETNEEDIDNGLFPVHLYVCHDKDNLNKTKIDKETLEKSLLTLSNKPIMGFIHEVNGEYEFSNHAMHIENDELVYDEIPLGVFPESCNAHLEYVDKYDKDFVVADGYLYKEYNKAYSIVKRYGQCPVSAELAINKLSYDVKDKILIIEDFYFNGVTILGKDDDGTEIKPAMVGANITPIEDKSKFSEEGGICQMNEKLKELLAKYDKTIDDIDITGFENLSDEEKIRNTFDTSKENLDVCIKFGDKNYSEKYASLNEEIKALSDLVYSTYDDWYHVEVFDYENDKYVVMEEVWDDKAYKQNFEVVDGVYSLVGERVQVFKVFVTKEERDELEQIKAEYNSIKENYEIVSNELEKYRKEPDKLNILNSFADTLIGDSEEYKKLLNMDAHFDFSTDELQNKLDSLLLDKAKSVNSKNIVTRKPIPDVGRKEMNTRYGDIFNN